LPEAQPTVRFGEPPASKKIAPKTVPATSVENDRAQPVSTKSGNALTYVSQKPRFVQMTVAFMTLVILAGGAAIFTFTRFSNPAGKVSGGIPM
ncbi:hypothetical protein, partial [Escherichia coli]|uniref:hypothetical protein n=1 Tax=Escherichia coli TaxID=562 RepID=UPI0028DF9C60